MGDINWGDFIHVSQFQNRRNRTKKPNGTWRTKPTYEGATLPLDSLRERMGKYTVRNEHSSRLPLEASHLRHSNEQKPMKEVRDPV